MRRLAWVPATAVSGALGLALAACSGGGGSSPCSGSCGDTPTRLEAAEVGRIIAQGVAEAQARNARATLAVVDRAGNVLGVFRMNGAGTSVTIDSGRGVSGGLEQIGIVPDTLAAIAKAITGAYLSSEGNAFSTRTASQIVQEHFLPGESGQPAGPLFGVQFSQLPCSDLTLRAGGARPAAGPQRSPLGLSADSGGFPLYKGGVLVGGVGAIADGVYGLDPDPTNRDHDLDELVALAATWGYAPPADRRADRITADGKTFRYSDVEYADLAADPAAAAAFAAIDNVAGSRLAVPGYSASGTLVAGTAFGQPESGIRPATGALAELDAYVLVDGANGERFPARAGTDASALGADRLSAAEVDALLRSALAVANRARAQIRRPLGSPARVSISVVDSFGAPLGVVRSRDAPVFGTDVSLQKARTAAFFSSAAAAADLQATPPANYLASGQTSAIADYVTRQRDFLGRPAALADGAIAFSARASGNLARPFFPDGIDGNGNGPLSQPYARWSPFSDGLQLDLVNNALLQHVTFVLGGGADVAPGACTGLPATANGANRLGNGIQIFPGGVPVYRGRKLVGGIGVSGDGVDQDDMIGFLGLYDAGRALGTINEAPADLRADQLAPQGVRLRYVQCPQAPFNDSTGQNACDGK